MENIDEIKSKTVSGVIWKMGERVLAQLINLIISIVLARILLPEQYGIVAIVSIFITIADAFVGNGLGASLIQKKDADEIDFSTMFYASLIISIFVYLILFFLAPILLKNNTNENIILILRVMAIRIPIAAINSIQQAYVSRKMVYRKFFFSTLFGTLFSGIVGIIMAINGAGVWALIAQTLANSIINTIVLFIIGEWRPKLQFSINRFRELFSFGWKVMMSGVIGTIFDQLKGLIIGIKYTSADLAYYNRGEQIPKIIYDNVNTSFETVLFSAISKVQDNKNTVKNALRRMMKIASYVIMPVMIGLAVVSEPLVRLVLTDKWIECVPYLIIVCFQQLIGIISNTNMQALKAVGRSDILLKLEVIKKPLYIICIIIAMQISPIAIVVANLIYGLLGMIINATPNKKVLNYKLTEQIRDILPAFIISTIMGAVCYIITFLGLSLVGTLICQVITGIIIYLLLSIIFKIDELFYVIDLIKNIPIIHKIYSNILERIVKIITKILSLNIFRVKNNKIVFDNFSGKGYGCNPKYICEEIIKQNLDYDLVWIVKDMEQDFPKQVRKVKFGTIKAYYELATAKVWVDNVRNYKGVNKKKNQYYIQTWHGTVGFKRVEKDVENTLSKQYIEQAKYDGSIIDLLITNNKFQEEYMKKYFWYNGEFFSKGAPRCDILYKDNTDIKKKVYRYFNIDLDKKIVLYAPTFRKDNNIDVYKFDYIKCCEFLKNKFNNEFVMLIRLHPNIANMSNLIQYNNRVLNATKYSDIQEILAASDVVISDYSSVAFEAGLVKRPSFILAKDFEEYIKNDRKLLYDFKCIPFEVAKTEEELYKNILKFSKSEYEQKCESFYNGLGVVNNDNSSSEIVEIIKERLMTK